MSGFGTTLRPLMRTRITEDGYTLRSMVLSGMLVAKYELHRIEDCSRGGQLVG